MQDWLPGVLFAAGLVMYNAGMPLSADLIAVNIRRLNEDLCAALAHLGQPDEVTVVAVSKTMDAATVTAAADCGLRDFGENRVQEAREKIPHVILPRPIRWHLVGHLQTNKAKDAVGLFDLIHSVDSTELARAIDHRAQLAAKRQDVLIQVNTTGESQKSGCDPESLDDLVGAIVTLPNLRVMGLMTIGPMVVERELIARAFGVLRRAFEHLSRSYLGDGQMRYCSMGMTDDWQIALAEGSNMLRIGRAIFGERG